MGVLKSTIYGAGFSSKTGVGKIPCVRRCLLALDRTANARVQFLNSHGYASKSSGFQHQRKRWCVSKVRTFQTVMRVHVCPQGAGPWKDFVADRTFMCFRSFLCGR